MAELSIECPSAVEINVAFECKVQLLRGSGVALEVVYGDGNSLGQDSPFIIAGE